MAGCVYGCKHMVSDTTPISVWGGCDLAKNALQDGTGTKEQAVEAGVVREGLKEKRGFGL